MVLLECSWKGALKVLLEYSWSSAFGVLLEWFSWNGDLGVLLEWCSWSALGVVLLEWEWCCERVLWRGALTGFVGGVFLDGRGLSEVSEGCLGAPYNHS